MNRGVPYIQTICFPQRKAYARQIIHTIPDHVPLILTTSFWYANEYKSLIVHKHQHVRELLTYLHTTFDLPLNRVCVLDAISQYTIGVDQQVDTITQRDDLTRYIHLIIV